MTPIPPPNADERREEPLTHRDLQRVNRLTASTRNSLVHFNQRPNPPIGLKFADGMLQWEPPANSPQVTHYRIYADNESNLLWQVPVGQTKLQSGIAAARVFVSAFNQNSRLESIKVVLEEEIASTVRALDVIDAANAFELHITPSKIQIQSPDGFTFQLESTGSAGGPYTTQLSIIDPIGGGIATFSVAAGIVSLLMALAGLTMEVTPSKILMTNPEGNGFQLETIAVGPDFQTQLTVIDGATGSFVTTDGTRILAPAAKVTGNTDLTGGTVTAPDGNPGLSGAFTVRDAAGTATSTFTFSEGLLTAFA